MNSKIRILIADDHALMRFGLMSFLAGKTEMVCVGEAENGQAAVELARQLQPDVVVMDLMMPVLSGAEATRLIRRDLPETRILILTSFGTSQELLSAITNGADGALMKDTPTEELVDAIREIAAGRQVIPPELRLKASAGTSAPKFSQRQKEILAALTRGLSNDDIGLLFGISGETVKKHLSIIFAKLGAANRAEATAIAMRQQLV